MIKLVISDLDGTLIDNSLQLPVEIDTITGVLREKGILFSIATGRSEGFLRGMVKRMRLDCPYVVSNGATLLAGDQVIMRKQFSIIDLMPLLQMSIEKKLSVYYTSCGEERVEAITPWIAREMKARGITYNVAPMQGNEWTSYQAEKLLVLDMYETGIIGEFETWCKANPGDYTYIRYGNRSLEFMKKGVSKASGVRILAEYLGVSPNEIMAIGDDDNDIEMFHYVGQSVAVQNAVENAKRAAFYVCQKPVAQGVFEAIKKFC